MTSVEALTQAVASFVVAGVDLAAEPGAAAAAQQSLDDSGLLLLGEIHGARENPLLARALMQAFGITRLALEWDEDLAPQPRQFTHHGPAPHQIRLHQQHGVLVLDLPTAEEAIVPHRSELWPPPAPTRP